MCRNIRILFNFAPPVTEDEVRAAALQYVRKVSGFAKPSKANEAAFAQAVDDIALVTSNLLTVLQTSAPPRNALPGASHRPPAGGSTPRGSRTSAASSSSPPRRR